MTDLPTPSEAALSEAKLVKELEPLVKPGKAHEVVEIVETTISRTHIGPLPPPEDLAAYERTHPGTAERIVAMAECQQKHRHRQESKMVTGEFGIRLLGQLGAVFSVLILACLVGFCAYIKQPLTAGVIAAIGGVAAYFLYRSDNSKPAEPTAPSRKPAAKRKRK